MVLPPALQNALLYIERVFFVLLLLLLLWAPLPQGSDRLWSASFMAMALSVLLGATWLLLLLRGQSPLQRCLPAKWPLLALLAFALLVVLQLFGGLPNPEASSRPFLFTLDPYRTRFYLLQTLGYTSGFALVLLLVGSDRRARALLFTMVGSALLQALLAIWLLSSKASYQWFFEAVAHGSQTTGTFINRNHLASYLYLGLSLGIGLILGSLTAGKTAPKGHRAKQRLVALLKFVLSPSMALRLLMVVMVIALVLSRSRMGNMAFMVGLLALSLLVWVRMPHLRRLVGIVVVSLLLIDVIIVGQWVGLERVVQRLEATELAETTASGMEEDRQGEETLEARLQPAVHTLPMIADRLWLGHGGGSYYTAFPPYKSNNMLLQLLFFDHAHNDYVEIAADMGLPALVLLVSVVLLAMRRAWMLASPQQTALSRGVAYGVWMASCCMALHAMVDFNLHIPVNALTFSLILALIWAAPWHRATTPLHASSARTPYASRFVATRVADWLLLPLLVLALAFGLWQGQMLLKSEWQVLGARAALFEFASNNKNMSAADFDRMRLAYNAALAISPNSPSLNDEMAMLNQRYAKQFDPGTEQSVTFHEQAAIYHVTSLTLRPENGWTWALLSETMQYLQPSGDDVWLTWRKAQQYAPLELQVQATLYNVAQLSGADAPQDVQAWVVKTQKTAPQRLKRLIGLAN